MLTRPQLAHIVLLAKMATGHVPALVALLAHYVTQTLVLGGLVAAVLLAALGLSAFALYQRASNERRRALASALGLRAVMRPGKVAWGARQRAVPGLEGRIDEHPIFVEYHTYRKTSRALDGFLAHRRWVRETWVGASIHPSLGLGVDDATEPLRTREGVGMGQLLSMSPMPVATGAHVRAREQNARRMNELLERPEVVACAGPAGRCLITASDERVVLMVPGHVYGPDTLREICRAAVAVASLLPRLRSQLPATAIEAGAASVSEHIDAVQGEDGDLEVHIGHSHGTHTTFTVDVGVSLHELGSFARANGPLTHFRGMHAAPLPSRFDTPAVREAGKALDAIPEVSGLTAGGRQISVFYAGTPPTEHESRHIAALAVSMARALRAAGQ